MRDAALFEFLHNFLHQSAFLDFLGIFFAQYLAYLLAIWFFIIFLVAGDWKKRFYKFALLAMSVIFARGIIVEIIRFFYMRPRPFVALDFTPLVAPLSGPAFPSSHATIFFALATVVYFTNRRLSPWFYAAAILMGIARVFAGVHWPSDIAVGALVGILSVIAMRHVLPLIELFREGAAKPNEI